MIPAMVIAIPFAYFAATPGPSADDLGIGGPSQNRAPARADRIPAVMHGALLVGLPSD